MNFRHASRQRRGLRARPVPSTRHGSEHRHVRILLGAGDFGRSDVHQAIVARPHHEVVLGAARLLEKRRERVVDARAVPRLQSQAHPVAFDDGFAQQRRPFCVGRVDARDHAKALGLGEEALGAVHRAPIEVAVEGIGIAEGAVPAGERAAVAERNDDENLVNLRGGRRR